MAMDNLDGIHVNGVNIGSLLAVNFNADEIFVHNPGYFPVFERFMLHHMAPVAGRIANADEHHFIFGYGLLEGFRIPCMPVNRVVGVLQKIRTGFVDQLVWRNITGLDHAFYLQKQKQMLVGSFSIFDCIIRPITSSRRKNLEIKTEKLMNYL
jgi:hypothetical protein